MPDYAEIVEVTGDVRKILWPDDRPKYALPILVIDFDGVLHNYKSGWKGLNVAADPPTEGAMNFLREAMKHFTVFIHSARSATYEGRRVMRSWLLKEYAKHFNLQFFEASKELTQLHFPVTKPHAHVTIDDRAVTFVGKWPEIEDLKNFKPWNR